VPRFNDPKTLEEFFQSKNFTAVLAIRVTQEKKKKEIDGKSNLTPRK
jgi:hypothetical protein